MGTNVAESVRVQGSPEQSYKTVFGAPVSHLWGTLRLSTTLALLASRALALLCPPLTG